MRNLEELRFALCQEWITTYGGSEQVALEISEALGVSDIYTFTAEPALAQELFPDRRIHITRLGQQKIVRERWQWFLPLMARSWRTFDFSGYDAVITSSHSSVNAIRVPKGTPHISYCHTPMRYAWDWRSEIERYPKLRPIWPAVAGAFRRADKRRAARVDLFIANSRNVAGRIERYYGRTAEVVYPPIDTSFWTPDPQDNTVGDYFLLAGRLVAYKRPEIAVKAAELAGLPLVVAGSGPELEDLQKLAGKHVRFVISPTREQLRDLYRKARALVFPGIEDFGMTMIESQACGTPVIAFGEGGALEAVNDGISGLLYEDPSPAGLADAMSEASVEKLDRDAIRAHGQNFDTSIFRARIKDLVLGCL